MLESWIWSTIEVFNMNEVNTITYVDLGLELIVHLAS